MNVLLCHFYAAGFLQVFPFSVPDLVPVMVLVQDTIIELFFCFIIMKTLISNIRI